MVRLPLWTMPNKQPMIASVTAPTVNQLWTRALVNSSRNCMASS